MSYFFYRIMASFVIWVIDYKCSFQKKDLLEICKDEKIVDRQSELIDYFFRSIMTLTLIGVIIAVILGKIKL